MSFDLSSMKHLPSGMSLALSIQGEHQNAFSLESPNSPVKLPITQGWMHMAEDNVYLKPLSLSDETKMMIVKDLFSEYDMTKQLISGDDFGISHQAGFNNFSIYPEAISKVYDLITSGVAHNTVSPDFLWQQLDEQSTLSLDFTHIPLSAHDQFILSEQMDHNGSLNDIKSLFDSETVLQHSNQLSLFSESSIHELPNIVLNLVEQPASALLTGEANWLQLESPVEHLLAHSALVIDIDPHQDLFANFKISDNDTHDIQLSFNDILEAPLQVNIQDGNHLAQNLSILLGQSSQYSSELSADYHVPDVDMSHQQYVVPPLAGHNVEMHFEFSQPASIDG